MTSIYKKQIARYVLRAGDGDYGTVALDIGQNCVTVMAQSSFGSYCYHWSSTGCNPIEFLRKIRFNYAMLKFRGPGYEVFDREMQEKVLRKRTIALRRAGKLDAEDARWTFDEVGHVCDARSLDQFWSNLHHSDLMTHLYDNNVSEVSAETRPDPECVGFWDMIWVPLMAHLGAEATQAREVAEAAA